MGGVKTLKTFTDIVRDNGVMTTFPVDAFACVELECPVLDLGTIETCEKERHCPFAHQRRREEKLIARARADAKAKEVSHADHD